MKQSRANYAAMFGPTTGDHVRLADTDLFIEVERDLIAENGGYGNEVKFGGGKVIRDGMAQSPLAWTPNPSTSSSPTPSSSTPPRASSRRTSASNTAASSASATPAIRCCRMASP